MTDDSPAQVARVHPDPAALALDGDQVASWLQAHPEFFAEREYLLADLALPHATGEAVSLVERQLGVLRDRNADLHRRLHELMATARSNHRIFERTLALTRLLLDADTPGDLLRRLTEGLRNGFEVDATAVRLVQSGDLAPALIGDAIDEASARAAVGHLLRPGHIVCGMLRDTELSFLFGSRAEQVVSAAVMPVAIPGGVVLLALGSADADHFTPEMGTLFVQFLGETVGQRLVHLTASAATG